MSISARIFFSTLIIIVVGISFFLWWTVDDLEPEFRKATEEPLVDTANILASSAAATAVNGKINVSIFESIFKNSALRRPLHAKIHDYIKKETDIRIYITDEKGMVIFDSYNSRNKGKDFSRWTDVARTLRGEYGARSTRDNPIDPSTSVMYVASPIIIKGKVAGTLSVGKPTRAARQFTEKSQRKIKLAAMVVLAFMIVSSILLSGMITRPLHKLTEYARAVRDRKKVALPVFWATEIAELGSAFEEMRDALEGRQYIERYVHTLTHEVKSPLSAIRGAVELLKEDLPAEQQKRFISNIEIESERIGAIIEKLLLLSAIETKKTIAKTDRVNAMEFMKSIYQAFLPALESKKLRLEISGDTSVTFDCDSFLIRQAVANLLQNAIDFSPEASTIKADISVSGDNLIIEIIDSGTGIPEYAIDKVYDHFYSLKRSDTGKKSSGLGLSLVKEIALLHNGIIEVNNAPACGTKATLRLPVRHS